MDIFPHLRTRLLRSYVESQYIGTSQFISPAPDLCTFWLFFCGGWGTDVNSAAVIFRQTPDYDSHEGRAGFTGIPSILTAPDKG